MTFNPFSPTSAVSPFGAPAAPFAPPTQFGATPQAFASPQAPAFAPQAAPFNPAGLFSGMGSAEEAGDRLPPLPAGGHARVKIGEVSIKPSEKPGQTHVVYYRAELTVIESASCAPGTRATFMERLTGHSFPHYRQDSLARIRGLVLSALGQDPNDPAIRAMLDQPADQPQYQGQTKGDQLMLGTAQGTIRDKEVSVTNVTHKVTRPSPQKPQGGLIASYSFARVGAPVAAPGPVAAPVQAAPAATFPPAGWTASAQYPGHYTGNHQGQIVTVSENDLRAAVAAGKV